MIPRIIHQTYSTDNVPFLCQGYVKKLKAFHPKWEYYFYDDKACQEIIKKEIPGLLSLYKQLSLPVQRSDLFRLIIVYLKGGFYLDIDIDICKPLDDLLKFQAVFSIERILRTEEFCLLDHKDNEITSRYQIANYQFAASPYHPFLKFLLKCDKMI